MRVHKEFKPIVQLTDDEKKKRMIWINVGLGFVAFILIIYFIKVCCDRSKKRVQKNKRKVYAEP